MATRSIVPRADGEGSIGTLAKKWGTIHAKNILTSDAAAHNSLYRGQEITDSWATIQSNIQAGNFDNYYIGDYKQITLTTGETVIMEIAGINCYKGWCSTVIPNHIDFISRDCLATAYQFNTTATNNGNSNSAAPWQVSGLFETLQGYVLGDFTEGVFATLPSDVKAVVSKKLAYIELRSTGAGPVSSDTGAAWRTCGNLWLPSETEVFDHPSWSEIGYGTAGFLQYPIFRLNPSKIIKGVGNGGTRCDWWTLSAMANNSQNFVAVSDKGNSTSYIASHSSIRQPLCFRIA